MYNIDEQLELPIDHNIRQKQDELMSRFNKLTLNDNDEMSIDLFHILKAFNEPMIIFGSIMNWLKQWALRKREKFISNMNQKLYNNKIMMRPKITLIHLSSGRNTNVATFGFKEMILNIVSNKSLFHLINLLLDPMNICLSPPESQFYGDVNTGS